jgi:hypothetical protein
MKYIYGHKTTGTLLARWAGKCSLTLASFFFWNLGTPEQKSQEGLSRALLFNVLDSDPSLIPDLLPKMWREAYGSDEDELSLPSSAEMKQVFERLTSGWDSSRKFCFFIDGLDEYSVSQLDGIAFMNNLSASSNIKIVLSSRPIPTCVEAFSRGPKLQLQDLTKNDIAAYVEDVIGSHHYMVDLVGMTSDEDSDEATKILAELVTKASGVFLWVVLACQSLLEGFAAFDRVSDLRSRVDELPSELENLFQHMLSKIEARYQGQAANLLRICHQSHSVSGVEPVQSIGLAIIDGYGTDLSRMSPLKVMSREEKRGKCRLLEGRLRSRCCGLLEIRRANPKNYTNCFCGLEKHNLLIDSTVEFMHRSVFEFLESPGVWSLSCLQTPDDMFEPNAALSCLSLHLVRLSLDGKREQVDDYVKDVLLYGSHADNAETDSMVPILFGFEKLVKEQGEKCSDSIFLANITAYMRGVDRSSPSIALLLAVEVGMVNFVRCYETMKNVTLFEMPSAFPLLYHTVSRPFLKELSSWDSVISGRMVHYLLSSGCKPNECFRSGTEAENTSWKCWLKQMRCTDFPSALLTAEVTEMFLTAGADVSVAESSVNESMESRIKRLLVDFALGHSLVRVRDIIREKGRTLLKMISERQPHMQDSEIAPASYAASQMLPLKVSKVAAQLGARNKRSSDADVDGVLREPKVRRLL